MSAASSVAATKRRKAPECENCFRRRIKCDGQRPECQKCIAKGIKCSGILDEFDFKFRDQSQIVRKKVEKQSGHSNAGTADSKGKQILKHVSAASNSTGSPGTSSRQARKLDEQALVQRWAVSHKPQVSHTVSLPPGSFTTTLFLDGHPDMLRSSGAADPWIAYMRPAINSSPAAAPLRLAAEAISLAIFGNDGKRPEASTLAIEKYSRCISALRGAIADPIEAAADQTLMTVLLLTIYEYVTSSDERGKERFYHHTDGVVAVAVYRRKTGSVSYQHMQMFWVVITSILMRYTYIGRSRSLTDQNTMRLMSSPNRRVTIPRQASVRNWIEGLRAVSRDPGGRLFELMLGTLLLRTKSHDFHVIQTMVDLTQSETIRKFLMDAILMNEKLDHWENILPEHLRPLNHRASYPLFPDEVEIAEIWPGNLSIFKNLDAACAYNQWRSLKIMVLSVGLRNLHWLRLYSNTTDQEQEFDLMREALYDQIEGMCASVPYFIGLRHPLPPALAHLHRAGITLDGRGALSIAVMLQFSLLVEGIPAIQRRWMKARLKYIAEEVGIKYATVGQQSDLATLIFEGDQVLTTTFGGRDGPPLSTTSLSVRSSSSPSPSPLLSPVSVTTTMTPISHHTSPEHATIVSDKGG